MKLFKPKHEKTTVIMIRSCVITDHEFHDLKIIGHVMFNTLVWAQRKPIIRELNGRIY